MTNDELTAIYESLSTILPNYSPDERSDAFAWLMARDNAEPLGEGWREALIEAAKRSRRLSYHVYQKEIPVGSQPEVAKMIDSGLAVDTQPVIHPPDAKDLAFAAALNSTLERLDEDSASCYILVELRGVSAAEAASIEGMTVEEVSTRVAGVNGLLRAVVSRAL